MAKHPVVVYGASGYTGMLVIDWLIDQKIPFTAIGRNAARVKEMMKERVVRLESAVYEIIEVAENEKAALVRAFKGARVVCSTVGPFNKFGLPCVAAALEAGCHYIDTTGEQAFIMKARDKFGELYKQAGLLLSPCIAYMYTMSEIAAELTLEIEGIDTIQTACINRGARGNTSGVTVGSTASLFEMFRHTAFYLYDNELREWTPDASFQIVAPELFDTTFCLPWGGGSLPIYYQQDARVRSFTSGAGFYDTNVMKMTHDLSQRWDAEYKNLPPDELDNLVKQMVDSTTPTMPQRERTTLHRSFDFAIGRGTLVSARATVYGVTPYITTGALQVAAVQKLLDNDTAKVGFASSTKAFGHKYMLGFLEQRGLARHRVEIF